MAALIVEFIGTFVLVFTVGMVVIGPTGASGLAPLAIGASLMVVVYAGGHVSGGHYNPAVSLAVALRRRLAYRTMLAYWVAQVVGAVVAIGAVLLLSPGRVTAALDPDPLKALVAEFIFTFTLCYVVLATATADEAKGNSYFGLAIGFTVMVGAFAVSAISGGAFNPAVAIGIIGMGLVSVGAIWIYLVANLMAAAIAAGAFLMTHPSPTTPPAVDLETS